MPTLALLDARADQGVVFVIDGNTNQVVGYFLAGDRLPWYAIGGSIIAANISTEHFIGMIGVAYAVGNVLQVSNALGQKTQYVYDALNRRVQTTDAPAARDDSSDAIRPWIWNSGIMLRQRSRTVNRNVPRILPAEITRLLWVSGTILGRDVVPEVCRTRAMSWGSRADKCSTARVRSPVSHPTSNVCSAYIRTSCEYQTCSGHNAINPALQPTQFSYQPVKDFAAMTRAYWSTILSVDDSVGLLYETLRQTGQLDRTIIVFMGDNGLLNGEHGMVDKRTMHEPSIRIVQVVRFPRLTPPSRPKVVSQQVLTIDMAPSLLELCGAPPRSRLI